MRAVIEIVAEFYRRPRLFAAGLATFALAMPLAAVALEHLLEVRPCPLCLRQRYIWVAVGLVALLGSGAAGFRFLRLGILPAAAALCLFGFYTAVYQVGLEEGWWSGECVAATGAADIEELRQMLLQASAVACDEVSWRFLGLSFAGWNAALSLAAAVKISLAIALARRGV